MVNKKFNPKKEKKRHIFQFTYRSGFLLAIGFFFVLGWVFFLGILVGKGLVPQIDDLPFIKKKIVKNEPKKETDHVNPIQVDELSFYRDLIDKKERAMKKAPPAMLLKPYDKKTEKKSVQQAEKQIHGYSIQVAALRDEARTKKMVKKLIRAGYQAYYYQIMIDGEIVYRIRCGPFSTIEKAEENAKRLTHREGLKPFIIYSDTH